MTKMTGTLHEDLCTFMTISRWILSRKRNFRKNCRENKKWRIMFIFFGKFYTLWDDVVIYCAAEQATDDSMAHTHCMLDT
jgi:hypothetical protein